MKKPETYFKDRVVRDLRTIPNIYFIKIQQIARCGDPDMLLCVNGYFVALELKRDEKEIIKPLQQHELNCIVKAGGLGMLTHPENWPIIFEMIKALSEKLPKDSEDKEC